MRRMAVAAGILSASALSLAPPLDQALAREARWCHLARPGDTLFGIARRHGTTVATLREINRLPEGRVLRAGERLATPRTVALQRGRLALSSPSLMARPGNLRRENAAASRDRLSRMRDEATLRRFVRSGLLVELPPRTRTYEVAGVARDRRVVRPWAKRFIEQMADAHHTLVGAPLRVTGLIRTEDDQRRLRLVNRNAAPVRGPDRSTHLTGAAVDLSARGMSEAQLRWMRAALHGLSRRGVLSAIEEVWQPHFHVLVFRSYEAYARTLRSSVTIGGC